MDPLDFSFLGDFDPGPSTAPPYPQAGYDHDALNRALRALQDAPQPPFPVPHIPQTPLGQMANPQAQNPVLTDAFLAALPWLQYMQMQAQFGQQQHHPIAQQSQVLQQHAQAQHFPAQNFQFMAPPPQTHAPFPAGGGQFGYLPSREAAEAVMPPPSTASTTPSPEAPEPSEAESVAMAEDKRRRNTAASGVSPVVYLPRLGPTRIAARFRIKKKQWTLNLERTISDLSGRVEELEREAAELRRENGWLKEIVMLKSKRLSGAVPELEQGTSGTSGGGGSGGGSGGGGGSQSPSGGKRSREGSAERNAAEGKGKGRHPP